MWSPLYMVWGGASQYNYVTYVTPPPAVRPWKELRLRLRETSFHSHSYISSVHVCTVSLHRVYGVLLCTDIPRSE